MKLRLILTISAVLVFCNITGAGCQNRNSLKAGGGVKLFNDPYRGKWLIGPSIFVEYDREFSKYISAGASLGSAMMDLRGMRNHHDFALGLRAYVSPFPKNRWLRWLEIGGGVTCNYRIYTRTIEVFDNGDILHGKLILGQFNEFQFGFDFPIRAYILDKERFDLLLFYEIKTAFFNDGTFGINYCTAGIAFGVKF